MRAPAARQRVRPMARRSALTVQARAALTAASDVDTMGRGGGDNGLRRGDDGLGLGDKGPSRGDDGLQWVAACTPIAHRRVHECIALGLPKGGAPAEALFCEVLTRSGLRDARAPDRSRLPGQCASCPEPRSRPRCAPATAGQDVSAARRTSQRNTRLSRARAAAAGTPRRPPRAPARSRRRTVPARAGLRGRPRPGP